MNISYNALLLTILSIPIICQEQPQSEFKVSEKTAQLIEMMYRVFYAENVGLESAILTQDQVDAILQRYSNKETFIAFVNSLVERIIISHKDIQNIRALGDQLALLIQKSSTDGINATEMAIVQAKLFVYVKAIEAEVLNTFVQLLQQGKSIQECEDIKHIMMHILVTM